MLMSTSINEGLLWVKGEQPPSPTVPVGADFTRTTRRQIAGAQGQAEGAAQGGDSSSAKVQPLTAVAKPLADSLSFITCSRSSVRAVAAEP